MQPIWFIDTLARVLVDGDDVGGAYGIVEFRCPQGHQPPPHIHHDHDENFQVMEGELVLTTPDGELVLEAGDCHTAPRGIPHTFRVISEQGARLVVTSTPAGFEAFVRDAGDPAERDELPVVVGPPDFERLAAAAGRQGIEFVGSLAPVIA
jgi:quercetin dioxygenase-like cupin family protein